METMSSPIRWTIHVSCWIWLPLSTFIPFPSPFPVCIWDIRPFAYSDRCLKTLVGHQHNFEKNLLRCAWSPDGGRVTAGSADRFVYIWDVYDKRILYKLPGH